MTLPALPPSPSSSSPAPRQPGAAAAPPDRLLPWALAPGVLVPVALTALLTAAFLALALAMGHGTTRSLDEHWLLALREAGRPDRLLGGAAALQLAREVTTLGSPWFLIALVGAVAAVLAAERHLRHALFVVAATGLGALAETGLKQVFGRGRPELVPHEVMVANASFPSGHAFGATMVYLTLAVLLVRRVHTRAAQSLLVLLAIAASAAVGISRVALGVHWPSDVLAGWAAGAAWALVSGLAAQALLRGRPSR